MLKYERRPERKKNSCCCSRELNCWCSCSLVRTGRLFTKWKSNIKLAHFKRTLFFYYYFYHCFFLLLLRLCPRLAAMQLASGCWRLANLTQWQLDWMRWNSFVCPFQMLLIDCLSDGLSCCFTNAACKSMLIELQIWKQWHNDSKVGMDGITFDDFKCQALGFYVWLKGRLTKGREWRTITTTTTNTTEREWKIKPGSKKRWLHLLLRHKRSTTS